MQGWRTGQRNRHTLAGVPTRPTIKRSHAHAGMLKKAKSRRPSCYGAAAAPLLPGRQAQITLEGVMAVLYLEIHSEEDFFAAVFLAVVFLAAVFLAAVFLAAVFLAAVFLAAAFSAVLIPDASCG